MLFAPFLTCPLRGAECAASAMVRFSLTVVFRFACLATWWRRLFEQCVVDFCSVPRGGVKKKNRSRTDRAACRGLLLCATRWREKKKKKKKEKEKSVEDRSSSVSRTSALRHEVA